MFSIIYPKTPEAKFKRQLISGKMFQQVKAPTAEYDDLSSISGPIW